MREENRVDEIYKSRDAQTISKYREMGQTDKQSELGRVAHD